MSFGVFANRNDLQGLLWHENTRLTMTNASISEDVLLLVHIYFFMFSSTTIFKDHSIHKN